MPTLRGSSPHTWGIRPAVRLVKRVLRFIPTYVGHTFGGTTQPAPSAVHPHIRGAYPSRTNSRPSGFGSSPHTWGIHQIIESVIAPDRFIPTYVGHTASRSARILSKTGSSPHTWGIRTLGGNATGFGSVHPHIRGAYILDAMEDMRMVGSSPHTWGIHWTAVRKMAGFSHFSYDFTRKSYFVQGLVFFGVIGAEAFPTHRRGRSQCLSGSHGGSVRNL